MGSSSSKSSKKLEKKIVKVKSLVDNKDKNLKKILFLLSQRNDLINKLNKNSESEKFILVNETINKYRYNFDGEDILKNLPEELSMETLNETLNSIEKYKKVKINNIKETIPYELNYNYSNDIEYPIDFFLIEEKWLELFLKVSSEKGNEDEYKKNLFQGNFINEYILINWDKNNEKKQYLAITLKDNEFNVDFIFSSYNRVLQGNFPLEAKQFLLGKKKDDLLEENKKIDLKGLGFVVFHPKNEIEKEDKKKSLFNIKQCFKIDKNLYDFIISLDQINNMSDSSNIFDEINRGTISLNDFFVFLVKEKQFKIILERLYFHEYAKHIKEDDKGIIENSIIKIESHQKESLNDVLNNYFSILSYEDFLKYDNEEICLINSQIYQDLSGKRLDYEEHIINLLKINEEFYLCFKKEKQIIKIKRENNDNSKIELRNIWKKDKKGEKRSVKCLCPDCLIYKLLLYSKGRKEIEQNLKTGKKYDNEEYSLVNKKWLEKYNKHYNIKVVYKKYPDIYDKKEDNNMKYKDFKIYLEKRIKEEDCFKNLNLEFKKFPEKLKDPDYILPKKDKFKSLEYPIDFEIIRKELFYLLIKEEDENDQYNIQLKDNNFSYKILFEKNKIVINNNNDLILVYFSDNAENNELYYIFQFYNTDILNIHFNQIISIGVKDYISSQKFNLSEKEQALYNSIDNEVKEVIFINLKPEEKKTDNNKDKIKEDKKEKESTKIVKKKKIIRISSFKKPPLIGLVNVGATCYMNATIQCFSNVDTLTDYFLKNKKEIKNNNNYDLAKEYLKLILNLWKKDAEKKFYEPQDFKDKIGKKNPLFYGVAANDSKDLILFILEELHKELNEANNNPINNMNNQNNLINSQNNEKEEYRKFKDEYYNQNQSIIQRIFYGEQESFTYCRNCKVTLFSFSIFNFLIFPLEKVRQYLMNTNNYGKGFVSLEDCFIQFISSELMNGPNQMYCNSCRMNADFEMWNKIYKHPEVLIIILNRGKGIEFQVPFQYPLNININKYINKDQNNENYKNNENVEYELISVITHIGDSSMSGHFIACCKSPVDQEWYCYNDAIVSECKNPTNIFGTNNTNSIPYVLFYQNKKKKENNISNQIKNDNLNNKIDGDMKTLYFKLANKEKEFYLDVNDNMKFKDVAKTLLEKYKIPKKEYDFFKNNGNKIDLSKTIKENGILNKEKIILKKIK